MEFRIGIVIGASLWLVTEQQHPDNQLCTSLTDIAEPCGCMISPELFNVVCGSDAQTYLSKCFLNCHMNLENIKIEVAFEGRCSRCSCSAEYEPLCGTDRVTYTNECVFKCFQRDNPKIWFNNYGECEIDEFDRERRILDLDVPENQNIKTQISQGCQNQPQACSLRESQKKLNNMCLCASIHRPVCSNQNKTYSNFCVLHCISMRNPSVKFQHWGVCGKPRKTPWDPEEIPETSTEPEEIPNKKRCVCAMNNRPVCGNNDRTYANFCVLHCAAKRDPKLEFQHWGPCGKPQNTPWGV